MAATLIRYLVPGDVPETVYERDVEAVGLTLRQVLPLSVETSTEKLLMFRPPLYAGAVQASLKPLDVMFEATKLVGASGAVACGVVNSTVPQFRFMYLVS
jgi:hypothetical protein